VKYTNGFSTLTLEFADGKVTYKKQSGGAVAANDAVAKDEKAPGQNTVQPPAAVTQLSEEERQQRLQEIQQRQATQSAPQTPKTSA